MRADKPISSIAKMHQKSSGASISNRCDLGLTSEHHFGTCKLLAKADGRITQHPHERRWSSANYHQGQGLMILQRFVVQCCLVCVSHGVGIRLPRRQRDVAVFLATAARA